MENAPECLWFLFVAGKVLKAWRLFAKLKLEYSKLYEAFLKFRNFERTMDKILQISDNPKFGGANNFDFCDVD